VHPRELADWMLRWLSWQLGSMELSRALSF